MKRASPTASVTLVLLLYVCLRAPEVGAQPAAAETDAPPPSADSSAAVSAADRIAVAIDLQALPDALAKQLDPLSLESTMVARLLEEGFAVVAPWAEPDVLLRAEPYEDSVRWVAEGGGVKAGVDISLERGTRAEHQLEIAHKWVELARARGLAISRARADAAAEAEASQQGSTSPPAARPRPLKPQNPFVVPAGVAPAWEFAAAVGLDALVRQPAVDPLVSLRAAVNAPGIFGLEATVGYSPSGQEGLSVSEWQLQAGPKVRIVAIGPFRGEVGALAGVVSHVFTDASFRPTETEGRRLDFLLTFPVSLTWAPTEGWLLGVRMAPGFAGRDRLHHGDGQVLWERGAARLEAGLQVGGAL